MPDSPSNIPIRLPSSHPELLSGLDVLLELGLISDNYVQQICRDYLTCKLILETQVQAEPQVIKEIVKEKTKSTDRTPTPTSVFASENNSATLKEPAKPSIIAGMVQSLFAELSVRWLLFLGMFLVVVSSGVLAASQWERFPAAGQYGVLFAYTLSFFGFSFWAGKQQNLSLTTQALLIVTLLLVPVNYWAMDSFGLWQSPVNWLVVAVASIALAAITVLICDSRHFVANLPNRKLRLINIIGLSFLHWGWKIPGFPIAALYIGIVGTSLLTIYQNRLSTPQTDKQNSLGINLPTAVVIYALLLLLYRGIFVVGLDITQLGLAIGICGWLVEIGNRERGMGNGETETSSPLIFAPFAWEILGVILLFVGWFVSLNNYPWQSLCVSGLGLWFFNRRLQWYSLRGDFTAIFFIGLQAIWLAWRLVPVPLQKSLIDNASYLVNSRNEPAVLLSIAFFPYVILMVLFTERLHRQGKRKVANYGEILTLAFAALLTTISLLNPALRSLNLLLSTLTLAYKSQKPKFLTPPLSPSPSLIYLTHITGMLTFCSWVDWLLPTLSIQIWAVILLALMATEWLFSTTGNDAWRNSAWHIGLLLMSVSYGLLTTQTTDSWANFGSRGENWGLIWLVTPITLTALASRTSPPRQTTSSILSIATLILGQLLILPLPGARLIGLGVACALMLVNTRYLRNISSAVITIGFALSFTSAILWELGISLQLWCIACALAVLSLWILRRVLLQRENELARLFAIASDKWAIFLSSVEILSLTGHSLLLYNTATQPDFLYLISTLAILGGIIFRSWQEPTNLAFYSIGWCLELLVAQVIGFSERSTIKIVVANIALGLGTQLFGEWWKQKHNLAKLPDSLHVLPLFYASFSILLRLDTFTSWTGLYTLGVALIITGVGRRHQDLKPLVYLGLIGVSLSAYELLLYQMLQKTGGSLGDGLIAMSALGASIMYAYRILAPWLIKYLRLTPTELTTVAHFHWVWSSGLLISAISYPLLVNRLLGLGTGAFLIRYAIFQGRNQANDPISGLNLTRGEIWVYLGLLEFMFMRVYWRETAVGKFIAGPLVPWNSAVACIFAYLLYILPWERWGWSKRPWHLTAYIFPLVVISENWRLANPIAIIIAALFYALLAKLNENWRFTYISIALVNLTLWRFLWISGYTDSLFYVAPIGLSLLYIAQVDPDLKLPDSKPTRHILRMIGTGLICLWATIFYQDTFWIPGIFSLIAIFAGLALRVRAYLYVGTSAFLMTAIYQLVIFSLRYPFLKWVIGLFVGITLIYIAANFETRKEQLNSLLRDNNRQSPEWE